MAVVMVMAMTMMILMTMVMDDGDNGDHIDDVEDDEDHDHNADDDKRGWDSFFFSHLLSAGRIFFRRVFFLVWVAVVVG